VPTDFKAKCTKFDFSGSQTPKQYLRDLLLRRGDGKGKSNGWEREGRKAMTRKGREKGR